MSSVDKRDKILRSALELIAVHGFHGATTALIAEHAEIGAGTLYCYFEGKDTLIYALHKDLEARFRAALLQGYPSGKPLRERFIHVGRFFVRYCMLAPNDFRFLEQFHNSPYGAVYRRDLWLDETDQGVLSALLDEASKEQLIKPLPKQVLLALFFGPLLCVLRDHILGFVELDEPLIEQTVAACWDAVRL